MHRQQTGVAKEDQLCATAVNSLEKTLFSLSVVANVSGNKADGDITVKFNSVPSTEGRIDWDTFLTSG